jgi:hypothetical protein
MAQGKAYICSFAERARGAESQVGETENISAHNRLPISDALVRMLNRKVPNDRQGRTYAELIAQILIQKAVGGDLRAIKEVLDRVEGRVAPASKVRPRKEHHGPPEISVVYEIPTPNSEASPISKVAS